MKSRETAFLNYYAIIKPKLHSHSGGVEILALSLALYSRNPPSEQTLYNGISKLQFSSDKLDRKAEILMI